MDEINDNLMEKNIILLGLPNNFPNAICSTQSEITKHTREQDSMKESQIGKDKKEKKKYKNRRRNKTVIHRLH